MNETQFDERLRSAMAAETVPSGLAERIDGDVARTAVRARSVRRWKLATSFTAVAVLGVAIFPTAQAQSVLARMAGALDDVEFVRMQRFSVMEDGSRTWAGTIDYERGKWKLVEPNETTVYLDGRSYRLDALTQSYIVEDRPQGPFAHNSTSLKLSSLLEIARGWGRKVSLAETGGSIVATIEDTDLRERTVVSADKESMLPMAVESYSYEQGEWRLRSEMVPDYAPRFASDHFVLRSDVPRVTKQEFEDRMVKALTSVSLATVATSKGDFKLRRVDVASDGTVFVAYQIGDRSRLWRGFRLRVTDDLGNEYTNPEMLDGGYDLFPKKSSDGRLELEVFVPLEPATKWLPRKIRLSAAFSPNNEMVQWNVSWRGSQRDDGTAWFSVYPNTQGVDADNPLPWKDLWNLRFDSPTCGLNPDYIAYLDYQGFSNDVYAQIYRSSTLARHFQNAQDWIRAERWLLENLQLKRKSAQLGYGSWSLDSDLAELAAVRQRMGLAAGQ